VKPVKIKLKKIAAMAKSAKTKLIQVEPKVETTAGDAARNVEKFTSPLNEMPHSQGW
jgi:hypothetical protein